MKKIIFLMTCLTCFIFTAQAQYKKDGTPDMRYKTNTQMHSITPKAPTYNYNTNSNVRYQSGYSRSNGTYVNPHYKTRSNGTNQDNYSTQGNYNPYTGGQGSVARDQSVKAYNYGSGEVIRTGPRGGQYYINSNGNKTYVPKR